MRKRDDIVKLRNARAIALATLCVLAPARAHAQESVDSNASTWLTETRDLAAPRVRIFLTTSETFALTRAPAVAPFLPSPKEIRLSRDAKTAIIVGAIVVGVLVLVGVVVIAGPGRKHL